MVIAHEVEVDDPVSHCGFRWMEPVVPPDRPVAIVTCMSRTLRYATAASFADAIATKPSETAPFPGVIDRAEPLGKRRIGEFDAVGMRHTQIRSDAQTGKAQSLIAELWYSPELKEMLEMKTSPDSPEGDGAALAFKLTEIHRGEPDQKLFYPPDGYTIQPGH